MERTPGLFARNCSVRRIDKVTAADFLSRYHRFGDAACRYRYGLFVNRTTGATEAEFPKGTLVAVAEFSSARKWIKPEGTIRSCEWVRYASVEGLRVIGGMGKLLEEFVREVGPDDVMTYADPAWSKGGEAYLKLGFTLEDRICKEGFTSLKFRKRF